MLTGSPTAGFSTHGFGPGEIPTILGMFNPVRDVGQLPIVGSGSGSAGIVAPVYSTNIIMYCLPGKLGVHYSTKLSRIYKLKCFVETI